MIEISVVVAKIPGIKAVAWERYIELEVAMLVPADRWGRRVSVYSHPWHEIEPR